MLPYNYEPTKGEWFTIVRALTTIHRWKVGKVFVVQAGSGAVWRVSGLLDDRDMYIWPSDYEIKKVVYPNSAVMRAIRGHR